MKERRYHIRWLDDYCDFPKTSITKIGGNCLYLTDYRIALAKVLVVNFYTRLRKCFLYNI